MNTAPNSSVNNGGIKMPAVSVSAKSVTARLQTIAPAQLRAARSLLDWSRSELAKASGVSPETIKNIEHGNYNPQETTLHILLKTFSDQGVEFFSTASMSVVGVILTFPREPIIGDEINQERGVQT